MDLIHNSFKSCRRTLTRTTAATVVNSLIVTRLDYCNGLLAGCTKQTLDKLQRVLNCYARVIFGGYSRQHVTPLLRDHLHWLRTRERISFKLCILVYKAIHGLAPGYLEPGYNSATGHSVWLVRSPGTVYHLIFVRHLHYQRSK